MNSHSSFDDWKRAVDSVVSKRCGMSADDLPDIPYRDLYDDGETPERAATYALRNAMDIDDGGDDEDGLWATDE